MTNPLSEPTAQGSATPQSSDTRDASLELFGHGWSPDDTSDDTGAYVGRHRASEA
jgi:hypothetical protein